MTEEERQIFDGTEAPFGKFWLPNIWMVNLIKTCYEVSRARFGRDSIVPV